MSKREFTVLDEYRYNRSGPVRWIVSHVMRYPAYPLGTIILAAVANWLNSQAPLYMGRAFDHVLSPDRSLHTLLLLSLSVLGFRLGDASLNVLRSGPYRAASLHGEEFASQQELLLNVLQNPHSAVASSRF